MKVPSGTARKWTVGLATLASVVLLWRLTPVVDEEWALWRRYDAAQAALNVAGTAGILAFGYLVGSTSAMVARAARVTALFMSGAATLILLELPTILGHDYGRTFGTRDSDEWLQLATGINRRDDELIHVHRPFSRFRGTIRGNLARLGLANSSRYDVDVTYDKNGFRNDVDFFRADIVAIGDSFVEAAETPTSKTIVAELSRRLSVPVVNLGQSGYGPQQELIVLKRYGAPLSPKTVVWFLFGGNDLSDVDAYEWRRKHLEVFLAPPAFGTRTFSRNALTALARLTTPSRRTPSARARQHEIVYTRGDGSSEILYLDNPEGPWQAHQWEVASTTLLKARDLTAGIGADFLVVFVPRKLRVYQGFFRAAPDSVAYSWPPNNLPDVLRDFCRQHGMAFLDSTVPLRDAVAGGESVYLPDDVHWNATGHRVVAAAVAARIQQMGEPASIDAGNQR